VQHAAHSAPLTKKEQEVALKEVMEIASSSAQSLTARLNIQVFLFR
jgi:hypothetical protein